MANIIQQFKNANGDNIFPLAYAQGGCKTDLLWTNPSPTSNFSAQTVSLDLSEYETVIVLFKGGSENSNFSSLVATKGNSYFISTVYKTASANGVYFAERDLTISNGSVVFGSGRGAVLGAHTTWQNNDSFAIPAYIYGIKMSYIVPTSVHGLQYVEV